MLRFHIFYLFCIFSFSSIKGDTKDSMNDNGIFEIGDTLHASCSNEFYGEIIGIGKDDNGIPTIDIIVNRANDIIIRGEDSDFPDDHGLMELELPEGVKPILRNLQYKTVEPYTDFLFERDGYNSTGARVVCATPGNGCYRCTKLFSVMRKPKGIL